jgi:hypothetical protein
VQDGGPTGPFHLRSLPRGLRANVLLSPLLLIFQSNHMCPPRHIFLAYSKECDIRGGDIKEVNE